MADVLSAGPAELHGQRALYNEHPDVFVGAGTRFYSADRGRVIAAAWAAVAGLEELSTHRCTDRRQSSKVSLCAALEVLAQADERPPQPTPLLAAKGELRGAVNLMIDVGDNRQANLLRVQARKCRRLALSVCDRPSAAALQRMALECEEKAALLDLRERALTPA